jgi:hypothetical protein
MLLMLGDKFIKLVFNPFRLCFDIFIDALINYLPALLNFRMNTLLLDNFFTFFKTLLNALFSNELSDTRCLILCILLFLGIKVGSFSRIVLLLSFKDYFCGILMLL